jgi:hypothetical protein
MTINRLSSLSRERVIRLYVPDYPFFIPAVLSGAGDADTGRLNSLQVDGSAEDDAGRCGNQNTAMNAAGGVIHK